MQKFNACRKRASSTHFLSSTTTRCINAICPAGPPKLMQPIFSQTRKASPKLDRAVASVVDICVMRLWPASCVALPRQSAAMRREHRIRRIRAASSPWSSSPASADRPSETACKPAASAAMSGRAVSAPLTISASRIREGSPSNPNNWSMVSNEQRSPTWLSSTSLMSNGTPPLSRATLFTWSGSTNRMRACGSRKRRISHGQAMRSIFGRRRVTQTLGRCGAIRSSSVLATKGRPAFVQPS